MGLTQPFAHRSLSEWQQELASAAVPDDRYRALLAVNALAAPALAVDLCVQSLGDVDCGVRALAARRLRDWHGSAESPVSNWSPTVAALAARLDDADPDVQFESARTLGQIAPHESRALDVLLRLLNDPGTQPLTLALVLNALTERADVDLTGLVIQVRNFLRHPQAEVRESASGLVARCVPREDLESDLVEGLDDDEPIVRENCAIGLGRYSTELSPTVGQALEQAARDEDDGVAAAAAAALRRRRT